MDTPDTASSALDTNQAAAEFAKLLDATPAETPPESTVAAEPEKVVSEVPEPEAVEPEQTAEEGKVTIEVDGKTVELTKAELAEAYKNGLRQADYTRKTMETAEQRKAADAEATKAREERTKYAQGLQQAQAVLQAQLHEQSQTDWEQLLKTDPIEYLNQQRIAQQRQAQLQAIGMQQRDLSLKAQAEEQQHRASYLQSQQQELLAKLPEWKDEAKAKVGREELKTYLKEQGLEDSEIVNIVDHRVVVMSRKAMLYDQMIAKAQAAAKKVSTIPQKVERPGAGESQALDRRTTAYQKLARSGSLDDAASVFKSLL